MVNKEVLPAACQFVLPSPCGQMTLSVGFFLDLLYATGMIWTWFEFVQNYDVWNHGMYEYWAQLYISLGKSVTGPITWGRTIILYYSSFQTSEYSETDRPEKSQGNGCLRLELHNFGSTQVVLYLALFPVSLLILHGNYFPHLCFAMVLLYPSPKVWSIPNVKGIFGQFHCQTEKKEVCGARWYFPKLWALAKLDEFHRNGKCTLLTRDRLICQTWDLKEWRR